MTERKKRAVNVSYKLADERIRDAYKDIIKAEQRIPSRLEVAKRCNISERTVSRHLEKITLSDFIKPYKVLGNAVLSGLFKEAIGGNVAAMKLYFMLIFDWSEKQELEHTGEIKTVIEVKYEDGGE